MPGTRVRRAVFDDRAAIDSARVAGARDASSGVLFGALGAAVDGADRLQYIAVNGSVSKLGKVRKTKIDGRTTCHAGCATNLRVRKRIEEVFGWMKVQAGLAKTKLRGLAKVEAALTFVAVACNLIRLPKLLAASPG